eukprot:TRINITY_DN7217_c0_g1_i3.p1 TRINITY_DN7217_c0_g1~~TRINITY_DN7217_c0_g1_i3.p1  ORF type:complete len:172 (+),score=10.70 TRINITY_DN7217_c0_g1_i3:158-673(+)
MAALILESHSLIQRLSTKMLPSLARSSTVLSTRKLHHQQPLAHALPSDHMDPDRKAPIRHFRYSSQQHPLYERTDKDGKPVWVNPINNKVWSEEEVLSVKVTHLEPKDAADKAAYYAIKAIRFGFDIFSGYSFGPINEHKFLRRVIFLVNCIDVCLGRQFAEPSHFLLRRL